MEKKVVNWAGFILVATYLLVVFLFGWGIYRCLTFPQSAIIKFFSGDVQGAMIILSLFGVFFLVVGGIFVRLFYKIFAVNANLKVAPKIKATVTVVSKICGVNYTTIAATGQKIATGNVFFLVCEFHNGTRKNFRVKDIATYNTIFENDYGVLTYKEYKEHTCFISFERQ